MTRNNSMHQSRPVVFVGSSILAQWTDLAAQLAPLPVLNRAVGGTLTQDQLDRFDLTFETAAPAAVVYYCGSNDLKAGLDPDGIADRFIAFDTRVRHTFSEAALVFLSSIRAPDRRAWWDRVDRYNALARAHCEATLGRYYFDLGPTLQDADGEPIAHFFQEDHLHLRPLAYAALADVLRPFLLALAHRSPGVPAPPTDSPEPARSSGQTPPLPLA